MKKVKTLIAVFVCIFIGALFGGCSCTAATVSVVSLKLVETSDNLYYDETNDKYLIRQGETFTITYELMPDTSSDKTVFVNLTPANKISCDTPIVSTNEAKKEIMFKASSANSGDTILEFESKDGGKKLSMTIEVVGNLSNYDRPTNVKYDETNEKFTWDKVSVSTDKGNIEATKYQVLINETEEIITETNSLEYKLENGADYYVRVKAVGTLEDRTGDSEYSVETRFYVVKAIENFVANDGNLTWKYEDVDNITGFKIRYGNGVGEVIDISANATSYNFANYVFTNNLQDTTYPVSIYALNANFRDGKIDPQTNIKTYIMTSRGNPQVNLTKLSQPTNLRIDNTTVPGSFIKNSIVKWDNVENSDFYTYVIKKNGEIKSENQLQVEKAINLTNLLSEVGDYTIEICPKGNRNNTFSLEEYSKATLDFTILPTLEGTIDYELDTVTLNTADITDMLGISTGEISKLGYEVFYAEDVAGNYTNVVDVSPASRELVLSDILNISSGTQFSILVRPYATSSYTAKNVALANIGVVERHNTLRGILQLKSAVVESVDENGVATVVDNNTNVSRVDRYKFILAQGGDTLEKEVYTSNITYDTENTNKFEISLSTLFNIKDVATYQVKVVPISDRNIDSNPYNCSNFEFTQLGIIDIDSITISNNRIYWNNVNNFDSYLVKINNEDAEGTLNNFYQVDSSVLLDENTITIQVIGNGTNKINGQSVEFKRNRSQAVSNIQIVDGSITWDNSVANSTYYVKITNSQGDSEVVTTNENTYNGLGKITSGVSINVVRSTPATFTSADSDTYNIEKLSTPTADLTIKNHTFTALFSENPNTSAYKINIYKASTLIKTQNIYTSGAEQNATASAGKIEFTLPTLSSGTYALYIQSLPIDQTSTEYEANSNTYYLISEFSAVNEFVVYPQVEIAGKTGKLSWNLATNDGVKDYVIKFTNGEYSDIITANKNYSFEEIASGTYSLSISATSTKTNVIYADAVDVTITKVGTPTLAFENSTITFTAVENAGGYNVYNQAGTLLTSANYSIATDSNKVIITPKNVVFGDIYEVYVKAIGASNIIDGDTSNTIKYTKISATQNITFTTNVNDKVFNWNAVENATGYQITIKNPDGSQLLTTTVDTNSYTIPSTYITGSNKLASGNYTLSVETIGTSNNGVYYFNADAVSQTFTKLSTISNMQYSNNTISWSYTGEGAPVSYILSVRTMDESYEWSEVKVATLNAGTSSYDLSNLSEYDGYKIYITAVGSDETYSITGEEKLFTYSYTDTNGEEKESYIFSKLSTPSITYDSLGNMRISEVVGARKFEIYSYDNATYTLLTDEYRFGAGQVLIFNTAEVNYTIVIKAIALSTSGMLDSLYSEPIKINQLAVVQDFSINTSGTLTWSVVDNASGYLIRCNELVAEVAVEGGASNSIGYETLFEKFKTEAGKTIDPATNYTFKILAYGSQNMTSEIYYLKQSTYSSTVFINAVDNIDAESLTFNNGVISWDEVSNVNSYSFVISEKLGADSYNHIVTYTVNSTSFDVSSITNIVANKDYVAHITPFSTSEANYIIVKDKAKAVEIGFSRYDVIDDVTVEEGIIKLTLDISKMEDDDVPTIVECKNYDNLDAEIAEKYKGYYTFKFAIAGYPTKTVTLKEMYNVTYNLSTSKLTAYYELGVEVKETTLLNIKITSVGNSGDSTTTYNTLGSFSTVDNNTEFQAYKFPAPTPTATPNLITENGNIYFNKSRLNNGTLVDKYILKAVGGGKEYFYKIVIPSGQEGVQTYTLADVYRLTYNYYGESGEVLSGTLATNKEYEFTLTTMGTTMTSGQDTYLRSNKYASTTITFLDKVSPFRYTYDSLYSNGGYLTWTKNAKCLGYEMYFLNQTIAQNVYGSDFENVKTNSTWTDNENVVSFVLSNNSSSFTLYGDKANVLPAGNYLVAVRAVGNGQEYISAPDASSTIVVYKMNAVNNLSLNNGVFTWQANSSDAARVAGYKLMIQVYKDGSLSKTIEKRELVTTTSYTLEEIVYDLGDKENSLTGANESYGLVVIAVGKNDASYQAVCSAKTSTNNSGKGYSRLNQVNLSVNTSNVKRVEWNIDEGSPNENNTLKYLVYNKGVATWGTEENLYNQYLPFTELTQVGDYHIAVQAIASGSQYLNSLLSKEVVIIKYYPPQLAVDKGQLVWESVQNGNALTPAFSTITIIKDGNIMTTEKISEFSYSLKDEQYESGKYTVSVKFEDNFASGAYSIASEVATIDVYKYETPNISVVELYGGDEESKYTSAIKWPLIKNALGTEVLTYKVGIYTKSGEDLIEKESYTINNADYDENYFDIVTIGEEKYIHFNISWMSSKYSGEVIIGVTALGGTMEYDVIQDAITNSKDYYAYVDSTENTLKIDYTTIQPENAGSDISKGIIKWSGSDNPVLMEITYINNNGDNTAEEIYLDSEYIAKYGKVYYLPYMVKYSTIKIQFVVEGAYLSALNQITMGDKLDLYATGEGTVANPYIISEASHLYNIKYRPLSHFKVATGVAELDMSEFTWEMIDDFAGTITGYVDNDGKTTSVKNIKLANVLGNDVNPVTGDSNSNRYKTSMFGVIKEGAVIKNMQFNFLVNAYQSDGTGLSKTTLIASVAQYNLGKISNIIISGNIDGRSQTNIILGGVVYKNYGTIFNTVLKDFVVKIKSTSNTGSLYVGGVVYENHSIIDAVEVGTGTVLNLGYDTINNNAANRIAAGVAYRNNGVILNTDFKGEVKAWSMAGIAYFNTYTDNTISLTHTYQVEGVVTVDFDGGTIVGCSNTGVLNLYSEKTTNSSVYIGGIAARNQSGLIMKSYSIISSNTINFSAFTGKQYMGGIVGFASIAEGVSEYPRIENSYSVINVTFNNDGNSAKIGSVVGEFSTATYPSGYGMTNVIVYSDTYDVVGVSKVTQVQKIDFVSSLVNYVNTLNQVSSTNELINQHSRDFANSSGSVILQQNKTIVDN